MRPSYGYILTDTEMKLFIRKVLVRCFYAYSYDSEKRMITTNADPEAFRRIYARAYCESLSKGGNLVVTEEEASNVFYMASLMQLAGKNGYEILKKENEHFGYLYSP